MRHIWEDDQSTSTAFTDLDQNASSIQRETFDASSASMTDVLIAFVLCAVILSTVIGNILALMAVCRISLARSVSHVYIGCLAVSDLLIGVLVIRPSRCSPWTQGARRSMVAAWSGYGKCGKMVFISFWRFVQTNQRTGTVLQGHTNNNMFCTHR